MASPMTLTSGVVYVRSIGGNLVFTSGQVLAADGSVDLPSYSFNSDPDTGFYWTSSGVFRVAINGINRYAISSDTINILATTATLGFNNDTFFVRDAANSLALRDGTNAQTFIVGAAGAATATISLNKAASAISATKTIKKVTGIADNTATDVLTVTIPNANHAAAIKVTFLTSNGSTDAFESSRVATGHVVVARTTGANAVATAAAIDDAAIATVAAGATHLLTYGVSAISGGAGATNTFTIQVTIDDSGNLGSNQAVVLAEVINGESTGITIA